MSEADQVAQAIIRTKGYIQARLDQETDEVNIAALNIQRGVMDELVDNLRAVIAENV